MKPTIFFAHSSLDRERILPIKDEILIKTGNAINIFMSSDGASIPFGKNWLKEIEDALSYCKIMFVWVTPNSLKSNWIYFESGYAYSRKIKVIPIGFDGVKLEELPAPLNILQGFNINSSSSLNNIIAVINQEFELRFLDVFNDNFYNEKVIKYATNNSPELLKYVTYIQCDFNIEKKDKAGESGIFIVENWKKILVETLRNKGELITELNEEIRGVGYTISLVRGLVKYPSFKIDPLAMNDLWPVLADLNCKLYDNKMKTLSLFVKLEDIYKFPNDSFLISSRLRNTEVDLNTRFPHMTYRYKNVEFAIGIGSGLVLFISDTNTEIIPLVSLIDLLVKQQIIINLNTKPVL